MLCAAGTDAEPLFASLVLSVEFDGNRAAAWRIAFSEIGTALPFPRVKPDDTFALLLLMLLLVLLVVTDCAVAEDDGSSDSALLGPALHAHATIVSTH